MYRCICDLVVVIVAFIHDEREIEVHCAVMSVKLLLYLHCNYYMILFETYLYSFNSSLPSHYQAQECETIGHVGVDLHAQQKIVH